MTESEVLPALGRCWWPIALAFVREHEHAFGTTGIIEIVNSEDRSLVCMQLVGRTLRTH